MIIEIKDKIFALTVIFFLLSTSNGFCLSGKCVRVIDGDTIVIFSDNKKIKVRLYGVDCPETKQKYGKQARQFTSRHAMGKTVRIEEKGSSYNRVVGIVYIKSLCLNSDLLKSGYAWYAPKYCRGNFCVTWKSCALLAKKNLPGSGLILIRLLRGTFEQEKPKHPSRIMTDVFKEIQAAKNFIVKGVNFLTVRSVQLFLKHQGKQSKRDLWRVGYACREQRDYLKIFVGDEAVIFASIISGSGTQALRMGTTKTAHRQGLGSAVAGPGTVHSS